MQITITVKDGATNKDIATQLRFQAGLIEGLPPKVASSRKNTEAPAQTEEVEETEELDEDDDFAAAPAKTAKKATAKKAAAAAFEDEEETEVEETSDDDFMEEAPVKKAAPKKNAKGLKLTVNDVNDACKAKAAKTSRKDVLKILKKFDVASVTELSADQYGEVIAAMKA